MRETWYVLEDGTYADPAEVTPDKTGKLKNKAGVAVAMRGAVPSTRSVDPDEERGKPKGKELKPGAPKPAYKTRESKAD